MYAMDPALILALFSLRYREVCKMFTSGSIISKGFDLMITENPCDRKHSSWEARSNNITISYVSLYIAKEWCRAYL